MGWFGLQAASSKCTAEMILGKQSVRTYCFLKHSFKMTVIHYVPTQSTLNYCSVTHEWEYFITQPSLKKKNGKKEKATGVQISQLMLILLLAWITELMPALESWCGSCKYLSLIKKNQEISQKITFNHHQQFWTESGRRCHSHHPQDFGLEVNHPRTGQQGNEGASEGQLVKTAAQRGIFKKSIHKSKK